MAHNFLSAYPDFNREFKINTDVRWLKLGLVISQDGKPSYFYSIKPC